MKNPRNYFNPVSICECAHYPAFAPLIKAEDHDRYNPAERAQRRRFGRESSGHALSLSGFPEMKHRDPNIRRFTIVIDVLTA